MREKIARFMSGRNGNDQLGFFMLAVGFLFIILGSILRKTFVGTVFTMLALADIVLAYVRIFSRNIYKRSSENNRYLAKKYEVLSKFRVVKERWVQRREYKFFSCPSCRTVLRVPRGRGKIKIVCTKCGNTFIGKS